MNFRPLIASVLLASVFLVSFLAPVAEAASTAAEITGEIERLTLNNDNGIYSSGVMIVGGSQVILPKNLLIDLPANRLTLQQIFDQAPAACKSSGESGLAKSDKCNVSGAGGFATLSGVHTSAGNIIAGDVLVDKGKEVVSGVISYISYTGGYFRVNGLQNDSATGVMVRLNDPTSRHTVQQGPGCAGGPNCSPDPRFTLDPDNYVNAFSTGYPFCIPSTVPRTFTDVLGLGTTTAVSSGTGAGDVLCPSTNRTAALVEPPVNDSRLFAPIMVGDSVQAEGNYETINGTRFLSAHTTRINKALSTKNLPTQPDYLFLEEVFLEAPGFQNQRARMLVIGFTSLSPTDVDLWTIHRDPVNNAIHEFPLASVQGCDNATAASKGGPGFPNGSCSQQGLIGAGANIFRIRYDVDFLLAAAGDPKYPGGAREDLNPCLQLKGSPRFAASNPGICASGVTLANNFGIMSPIPHEIQARTGHSIDNPGLVTLDIRGNQATNGQYLFPFGINLGGVETADFLEIDINLLNTPRIFEGIPWNLDRRLSPGGCQNPGGCEAGAPGSFALDPFPYTGLDPRTQADFLVLGLPGGTPKGAFSGINYTQSTLSNASNRVFSYVSGTPFAPGGKFNFDGNNTLLPCATGACPAEPGLIPINATPALDIFPPVALDDSVTTTMNAAVTINVVANDIPVLGSILAGSVTIATPPGSGTATVHADNSITYTPALNFVGSVTFSYIVYNNFFSASAPATVTVNVFAPATGLTVTADVLSPQSPNSSITFVASGSGGSGSYEYQFWLNSGSGYTVQKSYSTASSWTWTPVTTGTYDILIDVRNAGSGVVRDTLAYIFQYKIATPPTAVTMIESVPSPQPPGTAITFTATASGGSGPYEYRFWVNEGNGYSIAQNYGTANTFVWTPTKGGLYDIFVDTKTVGTAVIRDALVTRLAYQIEPAPATAVTLTPSAASPQPPGAPVTFTATASGGTAPYEYRFWINIGGTYMVAQNYTTTNTFTWTPLATGNYDIMVDTRAVGSTNFREALKIINFYQILPLPVAGVIASTDKISPQPVNAPIVVSAAGNGGSGKYEYRFWLNSGAGFTLMQDYSTLPNWSWFPALSGNYDILVDVRNVGSSVVRDASTNIFFYQIQ